MKKTNEQNSKNKILNTNNGITLIALIITIVVMLILVSVTITMAINGGLFEKAGEAVSDTQNAIDKEQQLANGTVKIGNTVYTIDKYVSITYIGWTVPSENLTDVYYEGTEEEWSKISLENANVFDNVKINYNHVL